VFARNLTRERIVRGADADPRRPACLATGGPRNIGVHVT